MNRHLLLGMSVLGLGMSATMLAPGCNGTPLAGPPNLRLGRDECAECGMLINDGRSAAAFLLEDSARRTHALFDDTGCLLDYERKHEGEGRILGVYIRDYETGAWVEGGGATFLLADPDRLPTPMGSGIAAYADPARAAAAKEKYGGDILTLDRLRPARRAWLRERYGSP
ncbi:MAG: hypothetical protein HBSAPP03_05670 [Phycisphaerae bacterium]|nr:MAG: hypothetical protein HBSAPP03_05670 [Phycisphaerae bacterium]